MAEIRILPDSVNTDIAIRDERMRTIVFEATLLADRDADQLSLFAQGPTKDLLSRTWLPRRAMGSNHEPAEQAIAS